MSVQTVSVPSSRCNAPDSHAMGGQVVHLEPSTMPPPDWLPTAFRRVYGRTMEDVSAADYRGETSRTCHRCNKTFSFLWQDGACPHGIAESLLRYRDENPPPKTMAEILAAGERPIDWLVDGLLTRNTLALLVSRPKVGKSVLARALALAVSRGGIFLDRPTRRGRVLIVSLEDSQETAGRHMIAMGAGQGDNIMWLKSEDFPAERTGRIARLQEIIEDERPALVVVDTLFRLVLVENANDYAETMAALTPLLDAARNQNVCLVLLHHANKSEGQHGLEVLGSTAIFGTVDSAITLKRGNDNTRTISTNQRDGEDMPPSVLNLDHDGHVSIGDTVAARTSHDLQNDVLLALKDQPQGRTAQELVDDVGGHRAAVVKAADALVEQKLAMKTGTGKKGSPFRWITL